MHYWHTSGIQLHNIFLTGPFFRYIAQPRPDVERSLKQRKEEGSYRLAQYLYGWESHKSRHVDREKRATTDCNSICAIDHNRTIRMWIGRPAPLQIATVSVELVITQAIGIDHHHRTANSTDAHIPTTQHGITLRIQHSTCRTVKF